MGSWPLVYGAACSEKGVLPRDEVKEGEEVEILMLNGNCKERWERKVDDTEVAALAQAISQTSNITELDISYSKVTDEGARHIAGMLKMSSSLQYLNLAYNDIGSRGWTLIAQSLETNRVLTNLNVAGNSICGEDRIMKESGGKMIGHMLRSNKTLRCLNFKSCGLGIASLVGIAQAMINHPSVVSLNIASPLLPSIQERQTVAQHLAEMLRKNDVIQELDLSRSLISDSQLNSMLSAMVANDGLRSLHLCANKLSQDGGSDVAKLLARRHDILHVDLSSNDLATAGATAIAAALRANQGITSLNLSFCGIGEAGLVALADALKYNTSLVSLFLWGNSWTPKAAKVFYAIRQRLSELYDFDCEFQVVDGEPQVLLSEQGTRVS
eukprot:TRINITY_DN32028_c0_g1_i1.p1 TRINITY_DN32028_c0_g1~~TRINITY_DN32028_c0_g1_i1.p1  ORF type:complete len:405 (+),score=167.86 TRINITY_DN32028_c0_g1_i1:68-1216(+)